jgi:4-amino-4-deoxy-L-arabinose transferase-like glycosyltransferase
VAYLLIAKLPSTDELTPAVSTATTTSARAWTGAKYGHPLVWVLLAGAIVRVVLWFAWSNWSPLLNADAVDYHGLATRLVTTGEYSAASGKRISLRPPLYPALVAATYGVAGIGNDAAVRAEQAVVSLLLVMIVYRLGVLVYDGRVALVAAAITCFYPAFLAYANLLLSETWFAFFAVGFTCLALEAVHRQSLMLLAAAGVAIALAALTRSIMLLFVPFLGVYLLWVWPGSWSRKVLAAIVPMVVFAIVISPWAIRNTRLQETLTLIDVMGGRNAMMGNYEYTPTERSWATISDVVGDKAWHRVLLEDAKTSSPDTQGKLDKLALSHAIRFVLANPILTLKRDVVKFFNFWQLERTFLAAARSNYFGRLSLPAIALVAAVTCGASAAVLIAAIFGITCVPPANLRDHLFLVGSILFPCVIHSLIFAHERYRLPVMPLLTLYASAALVDWRKVWAGRGTPTFRVAVVLCVVLLAGWLRELVMVDLKLAERFLG